MMLDHDLSGHAAFAVSSCPAFNSEILHPCSDSSGPCTVSESSDPCHECCHDRGSSCGTLTRGQQLWFSKSVRDLEEHVMTAYRDLSRRVDLVELCAPWDSPLSQAVLDLGGRAERWGCHNGFDLSTKSGCIKAMKRLKVVRPRYLHVAPPCDPWTILQNANQRSPQQVQDLIEKQKYGRRILKNCRKIVAMQRQELGGEAGGEHPLRAFSWKEPAMKHMLGLCGNRFRVDGCMFGMKSSKTGNLVQKSWGWFSSLDQLESVLGRSCTHEHGSHDVIEGSITSGTAVYPYALCRDFAKVLMSPRIQFGELMNSCENKVFGVRDERIFEDDEISDGYSPSFLPDSAESPEKDGDESEVADDPNTWGPERIMSKLRTIHANLGHPSNQVLCRMLQEAQAKPHIIEAAKKFECDFCRQRGHAAMHVPSAVTRPNDKWEVISVDTFWWYSPLKDEKGNSVSYAVGISVMDEMTNFHSGCVVRSGGKNLPNVSAAEFKKALNQIWLKHFPQPKVIRFDDEGAFRDQGIVQWLEGLDIRVQYAAGEAPWQVGRHSRHLATVKEIMSTMALEHPPEMDAEELLTLSLGAKNRLHQVRGYSPNQWAFGVEKCSVGSWLEKGDHLPTQSQRHGNLSFEENLQRIQKAKEAFLRVDSRRRILRAEKGKARKSEMFEVGQLVYFYRKGRSAASNRHAGWYGPARIVGVEKLGSVEDNQTQGSIVWISHGTTLYRCAPEQLRKVTGHLQEVSDMMKPRSVFDDLKDAGNRSNYKDISMDMQEEPLDSEVHEEEPPVVRVNPGSSDHPLNPELKLLRLRSKQSERYGVPRQPGADQEASEEAQPDRKGISTDSHFRRSVSLPEPVSERARGRDSGEGPSSGHDLPGDLRQAPELRHLGDAASSRESGFDPVDRVRQEDRGRPSSVQGQDGKVHKDGVSAFRRHTASARERERLGRDDTRASAGEPIRDSAHVPGHDGSLQRTEDPHGRPSSQQRAAASVPSPGIGHHLPGAGQSGDTGTTSESDGISSAAAREVDESRHRSRSPHPVGSDRNGVFEIHVNDSDELFDWKFDDSVGNCDQKSDWNPRKNHHVKHVQDLNLGCFGRRHSSEDRKTGFMNDSDNHGTHMGTESSKRTDASVFFQSCIQKNVSCCEIVLNVSGRDVHQGYRNGSKEWKLNDKPKRRAEVQFRQLDDLDKLDFLRAMQAEVGSYLEHEAVEIATKAGVPQERILGMRWVLTWKTIQDPATGEEVGRKPKARLIIKGFMDPDLLNLRKDSPTLNTQSRNMILAVAAMSKWRVETGDIKTAFLNGDKTEYQRAIFAQPPEEVREMLGMKPHEVFRVLKAIYGLLHAPRAWFQKLDSVLQSHGWIRSVLEPCVWKLFHGGQLCGIIGGHVDDLLVCGSVDDSFYQSKIQELRQSFPFGAWKSAMEESITFCGCELSQGADFSIDLNQEKYADTLNEMNLSRERKEQKGEALNESEKKQFRMLLGGLAWRATQTAPWLSASTSYLQGCFPTATVSDALDLNKLVRAQQHYSNTPLHFSSSIVRPILVTFHDASWSNRRDLSSQGGMISVITSEDILTGQACAFSPVSWQSKRLPRVCRSSTAAEIQMASTAIDGHEFLKHLMLDLFNERKISLDALDESLQSIPSVIVTDSKNMYDSVMKIESSGLQLEERRLAVEVLSYRDRLQAAGIECKWVDSDQQMADTLSKAFHFESFLNMFQKKLVSLHFDPNFTSAKKKRALRRKPRFLECSHRSSEDSMSRQEENFNPC